MNLREPPIRSQKLRRAAAGQHCTMNLPGICTDDPETVVLAHIHDESFGRGQKADDTSGAHMCHACHTAYDLHRTGLEDGDLYRMLLRAMQRTIRRLVVDLKVIIVPLDPEHLSSSKPTPKRKPPEQRTKIPARVDAWPTGRKLVSRNDLRKASK